MVIQKSFSQIWVHVIKEYVPLLEKTFLRKYMTSVFRNVVFKPFKKRFNSEKTILEHELKVNATTYLEVDEGLIPPRGTSIRGGWSS